MKAIHFFYFGTICAIITVLVGIASFQSTAYLFPFIIVGILLSGIIVSLSKIISLMECKINIEKENSKNEENK